MPTEAEPAPEGAEGVRPSWGRFVALVLALVACRGVALLCVLPPFEGWDEYQHVGYVVHVLETGRAPAYPEARLPSSLASALGELPHPLLAVERQGLNRFGATDYASYWSADGLPRPRPPAAPGAGLPLYQAQHGPLYYRLAAPLFEALGGVGDLRRSIAGLRLANLGLILGAVALILGALRRALPDGPAPALAGLALASHPLFLLNGLRVANDALGVLLGSAAVALGLGLATGRGPRLALLARCAAVGAMVGLASLAKATNFALVPFAAFAWLAGSVRVKASRRRAIGAAALMAAGFLAVVQGELRSNLDRYGTATAMQEAILNRAVGRSAGDLLRAAGAVDWWRVARRLWTRELFYAGGWSTTSAVPVASLVYESAAILALAGWGLRLLPGWPRPGPGRWGPWGFLVLVLSYTAGLGYHVVQSTLAWGLPTTVPWYGAPALPWFLALATLGGLSWPLGRLRPALPLALAAAGLAAEAGGLWLRMIPFYSGGASGPEALRRLASLRPGLLGTVTLLVATAGQLAALIALALAAPRPRLDARRPSLRGPHRRVAAAPLDKAEAGPKATTGP